MQMPASTNSLAGEQKGQKLMRYAQSAPFARGAVFVVTALALAGLGDSSAVAKDARSYVETAQSYAEKGNLKAAEIELRNAVREAPQDAHIHGLLAQVYLKLGEAASAEREARSARDLKGDETDYLLTLADA